MTRGHGSAQPWCGLVLAVAVATAGCGTGDASVADDPADSAASAASTPADSGETESGAPETALPTASVPASGDSPGPRARSTGAAGNGDEPEPGTPEWYLQEIEVLRTASLPPTDDSSEIAAALEKRNLQIVDVATKAVADTHADPAQADNFTAAARALLQARLQLALQGDEQHVQALYDDANSFRERDPKSAAAALAGHTLIRFTQTNASRYGRREPEWIREYARQARLFATNHPEEAQLAAAALAAAGRTCELNGLDEEARAVYGLLHDEFPDTPHGAVAAGVLRRLGLVGQSLELAGPTIDGGFTSIEDHRGRVVLVVFWSSSAQPFLDQFPTVDGLARKYGKYGLNTVGVCLDRSEPDADAFLTSHEPAWPQLFHTDPERRGWQHPVAVHYGIRDLPTYVLVDHRGTARWTGRDASELEGRIRKLLLELRDEAQQKDAP